MDTPEISVNNENTAPSPVEAEQTPAASVTASPEAEPAVAPLGGEGTKRQELFSEQFQRLAREKRQLEKVRDQLKQQEKEYKTWKERETRFREDPTELLTAYGWELEQLQEAILQGRKPESMKLKEIERKIAQQDEQRKLEEQGRVDAETKRQWDTYVKSIGDQIKTAGDKYELINTEECYSEVPNLMLKYHEEFDENLTWAQAADMIEKELESQLLSRGEKYKKLKKLRKLFEVQQEKETEAAAKPAEDKGEPSQKIIEEIVKASRPSFPKSTLTNDLATSSTPAPRKYSSREEEVLEAAKILRA